MVMLSIIIPVYQVEETLERCVNSILRQNFSDYEILLIDDGSTDRSPEICEQLEMKDCRIKVYHKKNGGLSDARNYGIERCKGNFITFVDSDDTISDGILQPLMNIMLSTQNVDNNVEKSVENYVQNYVDNHVDILEYSVSEHYGHPKKQHYLKLENRIYNSSLDYILKGKAYLHSYAWNKIYRKEIFDDIRFEKGKKFEDMHNLVKLFRKAGRIQTTDIGNYIYYWNPKGITAKAKGDDLSDLLDAHVKLLDLLRKTPQNKNIKEMGEYYSHILNIQLDVYELTGKKPILPEMKYKTTIKEKIMNIIGIESMCRINCFIHKFFRRG